MAQDGLVIGIWNGNDGNKMPVSLGQESRWNYMKINLWDGLWKFEIDWKAVVGIGIIILGCALFNMWGGIN